MNKNIFNSIKLSKPKSNVFDLTHDVKLSCKLGSLVPICLMECVPGDKFNIGCESLLRLAPLVSPVMHRMDVTIHYFFVPNRILWLNWDKFITNTNNPVGDVPYAFPILTAQAAGYGVGTLSDYLGVPLPIGANTELVNALPFAAYQKVYDEYYRDQNLIPSVWEPLSDGNNDANAWLIALKKRCWEHDYFTASLPFAQKGDSVSMPIGEVRLKDDWYVDPDVSPFFEGDSATYTAGAVSNVGGVGTEEINVAANTDRQAYDPDGSLETASTTINDLRRAFRLQEWLEKAAKGGSRYFENILVMFGVKSPDMRLQRPEYITGTKSPVVISEVLNTTGDTSDNGAAPQGNMSGHGVSVTAGKSGNYFCQEHGYIIGIMSVLPRTCYQQGLEKHWLKTGDCFQYYWPSFANIGEQEVFSRELYAYHINGDATFGYVPRYAEYKYMSNRVAGEFRTSLDFWHMGRIFGTVPELNGTFVTADPTERIFAVQDGADPLYCHVLNKIRAVRRMPKFGTPSY